MDAWIILRIMFGCYGGCLETPEIRHLYRWSRAIWRTNIITSWLSRRRSWTDKGLPPRCIARPKRTNLGTDVIEKLGTALICIAFSLRFFPFFGVHLETALPSGHCTEAWVICSGWYAAITSSQRHSKTNQKQSTQNRNPHTRARAVGMFGTKVVFACKCVLVKTTRFLNKFV